MTLTHSVWALDTGRTGEYMQVETLAKALGLVFERIPLSPEGIALAALPSAPPRLILSFGRSAQAALRLAGGYNPRPLLVHLGTPGQTPIDAFDLIIPMPQDDYPPAPNVLSIRLPLNGASLAASALPPPRQAGSCTVVIGGPSRHFRLPRRAIARLVRFAVALAEANREALHVVTSPRTPAAVVTQLRSLAAGNRFALHVYGDTPFSGLLQNSSRLVVTADSASMLGEACRTGAPVWLFSLPSRSNLSTFLQRATDRCLGPNFRHWLVRRGWVGGGTDFRRWHCALESLSYIQIARTVTDTALRWAPSGMRPDTDLRDCRTRILGLLANTARPGRPGASSLQV